MRLKDFLYLVAAIILISTGIGSILYLSYNIVVQLLVAGLSWMTSGFLIFYLITSVPTFQAAGELVSRGLSFWKTGARGAVAFRIERNLNSVQEEINDQVKGLIPYPAKVEWVDKPSYLDTTEEKVIIRMKEYKENPRNVAYAVIDYISEGMIPFSRLYLETPIQTAMDSTMVRIILLDRDKDALNYFLTNVLNRRLGEEGVRYYMTIMNNLYRRGLFSRVFLEEVKELGLKLYPMEDPDARREITEYVAQLNVLATRERGERRGAEPYIRQKIKVAFLLIAEPEKIREKGDAPYVGYAGQCIRDGAEVIYFLSRGGKNRPAMRLANKIAKLCFMEIYNTSEYEDIIDDEVTKALCIELRRKKV